MKPRVCILKTDGINCDQETAWAFRQAGAQADIVFINQLRTREKKLNDYQLLVIPGGFAYGDDIASGKIFAVELLSYLREQLERFMQRDTLMIGICNGFQVLVRTGLLPFGQLGITRVTLTLNDSGVFECRWVTLLTEKSPCLFTQHLVGKEITLPVAHAEGNFFTDNQTIEQIERQQLVALRYTANGNATETFPHNPNGSMHAIAGICDPSGRIFGLMPHPERFVIKTQHPNWRQSPIQIPYGLQLFKQAIKVMTT